MADGGEGFCWLASSLSGDHATVCARPGYTATRPTFWRSRGPALATRAPVMSEAPPNHPQTQGTLREGQTRLHPKAGTKLPLAKAAPRASTDHRRWPNAVQSSTCSLMWRRPTPDQGRCFKPLF